MALEWRKDPETCTYTSTNDEYIIHKQTKNRFHLHRQGVIETPLVAGTVKVCKGFAEDLAAGRIKLNSEKHATCKPEPGDTVTIDVYHPEGQTFEHTMEVVHAVQAESPPVLPLQGDLIEVQQEQYKGLFGPRTTRVEDWLPPGKYEVIDNHVLIQTHEDGRYAWGVLLGRLRLRSALGMTPQRWYITDPHYLCLLDVNCQIADAEKQFTVIEYHTGFALRHNPTGQEKWLGDGVDTLFDPNSDALRPGTPGFLETWQSMFDEICEEELLEAYFPYMKDKQEHGVPSS